MDAERERTEQLRLQIQLRDPLVATSARFVDEVRRSTPAALRHDRVAVLRRAAVRLRPWRIAARGGAVNASLLARFWVPVSNRVP
jgi:hypothetical protein